MAPKQSASWWKNCLCQSFCGCQSPGVFLFGLFSPELHFWSTFRMAIDMRGWKDRGWKTLPVAVRNTQICPYEGFELFFYSHSRHVRFGLRGKIVVSSWERSRPSTQEKAWCPKNWEHAWRLIFFMFIAGKGIWWKSFVIGARKNSGNRGDFFSGHHLKKDFRRSVIYVSGVTFQ